MFGIFRKKPSTYTITVTEEHLNGAIRIDIHNCLMAKAVKAVVPDFSYYGITGFTTRSGKIYRGDTTAYTLLTLFDSGDHDKLRKMLPCTVNFKEGQL